MIGLIFSGNAFGQKAIPASWTDIVGRWSVVPVPQELQSSNVGKSLWPASCQFISFYDDGYLVHQQSEFGECRNQIPQERTDGFDTVTWSLENGFMKIVRSDYKMTELWKVDRVNTNTHLDTLNLNEGDMLMQLIDTKARKSMWLRVLRREGS
ncbi:MAG: hypothetical protein AAGI11_18290 [Pseudomonadota bacterium]